MYTAEKAIAQTGWKNTAEIGVNIGSSRGATHLFEKYHEDFLINKTVYEVGYEAMSKSEKLKFTDTLIRFRTIIENKKLGKNREVFWEENFKDKIENINIQKLNELKLQLEKYKESLTRLQN